MSAQERERYEEEAPVGGTADLVRPPAGDAADGPTGEEATTGDRPDGAEDGATPLLPPDSEERFRRSWESVQVAFVDEPRRSVQQADQLVAELMRELAESFAGARSSLEAEWDRGEDVSTEDLRVALQRYRSFFQRLLAA
jgi:hypothetical protein